MSEISKERVEALASNILECHDVKPSEVKALAALALMALRERAEPVAWVPQYQLDLLKKSVIVEADLSSMQRFDEVPLYAAPPAPVLPEGLRIALSNAGIAAPESDEMLWASQQDYIQMLVTWVKDRKPFKHAPVVPEWTNQQCLEFLAVAFRHAEIKGDFELDDLRLGVKMANAMAPGKKG